MTACAFASGAVIATRIEGYFYPEIYGEKSRTRPHFDTVEINNTFYRMPDAKMTAKWTTQVPESFTFVLKAPQRITHQKRLAGADDDVALFFEAASWLGSKLGPARSAAAVCEEGCAEAEGISHTLPAERKVAFEFRHPSWCDEEIYALLRERDAPLCLSDTDESGDADALVVPTASRGYLRLRRTEYSDGDLEAWARRVERQKWDEAYVFFKHEDEAKGPAFAKTFRRLLNV